MSSDTGSNIGDVSRARELLTQAVQFLDSSGGRNLSATRDQRCSSPEHFGHSARSLPFSGSRESSALAERSLLFNFGGKRKLGSGFTSSKKKKKVAVTFWNHEFVCLSDTEQDRTPTASERANLIASGVLI